MQIDEIWLLDEINHGASVDLNAGRLGPVYSWGEAGRDVINFIEHVWPARQVGDAPAHGSGKSSGEQGQQLSWKENIPGARRRKIAGVGHSFGGNAM